MHLSYNHQILKDDQFNSNRSLIESTKLKEHSGDDDNAYQFSTNFDTELNDGSKITAVFQYEKNSENESSDIKNTNPNLNEKVAEYKDQKRLLLQGDYVLKINETTGLEFGYRGSFLDQETDFKVYDYNEKLRDSLSNINS